METMRFGLWMLLVLLPWSERGSGPIAVHALVDSYSECYDNLVQADADQDGHLTTSEYGATLVALSGGLLSPTAFTDLDPILQRPFLDRAIATMNSLILSNDLNSSIVASLCTDIYQGLLQVIADVRLSEGQCLIALALADTSRDNVLVQQEYVRFASRISGGQYSVSAAFDELPLSVQAVFSLFRDASGEIDVTGSRPGQMPQEDLRLGWLNLCRQTALASLVGELDNSTVAPVPTVAPSVQDVGNNSPTMAPEYNFQMCTRAMLVSDISRDEVLSSLEYVRFVNRLAENAWVDLGFDDLPQVLRDSFDSLALLSDNGLVVISGIRPGQVPTPDQLANLRAICSATQDAVQEALTVSTPPPTVAPSVQEDGNNPPTKAPEYSFRTCTLDMVVSDINRDEALSSMEYVRFVDRWAETSWNGFEFHDLPQVIQDAFKSLTLLSNSALLSISGARPGQVPTSDQLVNLQAICSATHDAIQEALAVSMSPSSPPTGGSDVQSNVPTNAPSESSSPQPTFIESDVQSDIPSDVPSDLSSPQPTFIGSDVPSNLPSNAPSDSPSLQPTQPPTMTSVAPSSSMSEEPSTVRPESPSPTLSPQTLVTPTSTPTLPLSDPTPSGTEDPTVSPTLIPEDPTASPTTSISGAGSSHLVTWWTVSLFFLLLAV